MIQFTMIKYGQIPNSVYVTVIYMLLSLLIYELVEPYLYSTCSSS